MSRVAPPASIRTDLCHMQKAIRKYLGLKELPPGMAIVGTPPETEQCQQWHIDDLTAHNAVVIPLSNGHSHTEFLHMRGYNYRSRKPYEVYGKFRDAVDWKDSDEDRRAFAITPRPQLRIGDAILFNTQHVHRGPLTTPKTGGLCFYALACWYMLPSKDKMN